MSQAGNIEAIRDWSNRYFYKQSDVNEFFLKMNAGLNAYKLTFLSSANSTVHVVEDALTDTQSYDVDTDENGIAVALLFFHSGSTITATCGQKTATAQLTDYVMTINVNQYISYDLITPVGDQSKCIYSSEATPFSRYARLAFNKVINTVNDAWIPTENNAGPHWLGYHFDTAVIPTHVKIYTDKSVQSDWTITYQLQGSHNNSVWDNISPVYNFPKSDSGYKLYEFDCNPEDAYEYLRVYFTGGIMFDRSHNIDISELYFYGYVPEE